MNFPGTSINDLVLDQPEESDDEQNGVENDGNDEDGVDEESEENQGWLDIFWQIYYVFHYTFSKIMSSH